ncbi:MAG: Nif3-like dinuclear metal center hexameric protein [bacterium]|nr:Nif3-like dinuclear metal center hexameric protein [bacterium]
MPPSVAEVIVRLREAIPLSKAASWDAVGLQVGDPSGEVESIAVCHEVSVEVVDAAVADQIDILVAYHPLLFRPGRTFVAGDSASGRAYRLAAAGVSLFVVHTAYDVVAGGCADALADALDLEDVKGFGANWPADSAKIVTYAPQSAVESITSAMSRAGAGQIGDYSECSFTVEGVGSFRPGAGADPVVGTPGELSQEPEVRIEMNTPAGRVDNVVTALAAIHPYQEPAFDIHTARANSGFIGRVGDLPGDMSLAAFSDLVGTTLPASVRVAGDFGRLIRRVAVVPGSGSDFTSAAAATGADVFVTGDVSHHRGNEAMEHGLAVIDAGHSATERPGMARLYSLVSKMFTNTIDLTHIDPNPWGRA